MCRLKSTTTSSLVLSGLILACGSHVEQAAPPHTATGAPKVAVIVRESAFKTKLVDRIVKDYGQQTELSFIDISQLNKVDAENFQAMVVMGARMGFLLFNFKERRFLRRLDDPQKVVLLMTAAVPDWTWDRDDVDVISGASIDKNLTPIYKQMRSRLDAILQASN